MSGIVGIFHRDGRPVDEVALQNMNATIAHRGLDGGAVWHGGNIGLGHRMLWTTPESLQERLPLVHQSQNLAITADARIDNRDELLSILRLTDRPAIEVSDSQLILEAYAKWGETCPTKLLGDFAFAIWDGRNRKLFCARDHLGLKSFCYHVSNNTFVFGSEIKALISLPDIPRRLNENRVADYLLGNFEDTSTTFYQDILRLPAAHSLTISANHVQVQRYWELNPAVELRLGSDAAYIEAFREVFTDSVRCRLRSAFPVGSALSGGLDSSSIACTARNQLSSQDTLLHTFSAIFPSLPEHELKVIDERSYMDAVLTQGGFIPHYIEADQLSPFDNCESALAHMDEPFIAANLYIHWAMYRTAQKYGVRIFLDGIDGDTTISHGTEHLRELARSGQWIRLINEGRALSRGAYPTQSPQDIIWQYGVHPLLPTKAIEAWHAIDNLRRRRRTVSNTINQDFARRVNASEQIHLSSRQDVKQGSRPRLSHYRALTSGLIPYALELMDKTAAAFSIESRLPFFDRRLVEFCLALPPHQKLHGGWTRAILRHAMIDTLPPVVRQRVGKADLSPNFNRNLLRYDREIIESMLFDNANIIEGYVDIPILHKIYKYYGRNPSIRRPPLVVYAATNLALGLKSAFSS